MNYDRIQMLNNTLNIFKAGQYVKNGKTVYTKLSEEEREECYVFLPEDVHYIINYRDPYCERIYPVFRDSERISVRCTNADSFSVARGLNKLSKALYNPYNDMRDKALVLNFANPVNPGGGVRGGAKAQEEDLCRKSSLLLSLESDAAKKYYEYNKSAYSNMGSDAIILTPNVEIIRDADGELLDDSFIVSVLTCAAPVIYQGMGRVSYEQYKALFYNRICGILKFAAFKRYPCLVLGAFGCGAFGNDAKLVSDLFYKALKEFSYNYNGFQAKHFFKVISFAVLDKTPNQYNFKEFNRNFASFYRDEDAPKIERANKLAEQRRRTKEMYLDAVRGSLFGGAVGDALGYPIEFMSEYDIFERYGFGGITKYDLDKKTGKALISDDTQMTLFTANGLLIGNTRGCMRGIQGDPHSYAAQTYQDWLYTQTHTFEERDFCGYSWLLDVPELYARRAPGTTCLSALEKAKNHQDYSDCIANPRNNSKGCGGVMRVAPFALDCTITSFALNMKEAARFAAITHGHSLGYMPAAVLCHIIKRIIFPEKRIYSEPPVFKSVPLNINGIVLKVDVPEKAPTIKKMTLKEIVIEAKEEVIKAFEGDRHLGELTHLIDRAVELSENNASDLENIKVLGKGWVAEEALAIAIYCSLKYSDDFSKGVIAAVNHGGDSDSTGAITGNILGALVGYNAIENKWKNNLECADIILEIADDLCYGCQMREYDSYRDAVWESKYINMRRYIADNRS